MLKLEEHIQDNVHGRIDVTKMEQDICRSPSFARLSRIQQLGLASTVFPSASHTRASHSIGTLHVMGQIIRSIDLTDDDEIENLRLAALLHDIGQYPLSHVIESVYQVIGDSAIENIVGNTEQLGNSYPPSDTPQNYLQPVANRLGRIRGRKFARDKDLAAEIIRRSPDLRRIFANYNFGTERIERIIGIATGNNANVLHKHLMDSDYDCDRLDYVLRDATQTGVKYGQIDLNYLIEQMCWMRDPPIHGDRVLAIDKRRALHALEHYLTGRYYMYSQIIYHKTVKANELLAKGIYLALAKQRRVWASFKEIEKVVGTPEFLMFDDVYFYNALYQYYREANRDNDPVAHLIQRLLFWNEDDERLPMVKEWRFVVDLDSDGTAPYGRVDGLLSSQRFVNVCKEAGVDPAKVAVEELPVKFLPLGRHAPTTEASRWERETRDTAIRFSPRLKEEGSDRPQLLVSEPASILHRLSDLELRIIRVFVLENDNAVRRALETALNLETRGSLP